MHKANATLKGKLNPVKRVRTSTKTTMATFSVDETPCKAFGENAEVLLRWASGNLVELDGYYETRSQKFGREFVAVRGQLLWDEKSGLAPFVAEDRQGVDKGETLKASVPTPSDRVEPIPTTEPIGVMADLGARKPPTPLSNVPPTRPPRHAEEVVPVKPVTFEDLENQYKALKAARELEKLKQAESQGIEGGQVA